MGDGPQKRKPHPLGMSMMLAQAGVEMVVPIGLGVWLDMKLDTRPWLTLSGIVVGFVGGLLHLVILAKRIADSEEGKNAGS